MGYSLIEKLYANKPYRETVEVLGRKVEFKILSAKEEAEVILLSDSSTFLSLLSSRKIPTLARSIERIDGVPFSEYDEIKQRVRSNPGMTPVQAAEQELGSYPDEILSSFFGAFNNVRENYRESLDTLKKSSKDPSPETAG